MNHDLNFDGASLLIVGERILEAARERPALGLALGRERPVPSDPGQWSIGTRVARTANTTQSDVRFEGGAPPLRALAARIQVGDFGQWFGELKADQDGGRLHFVRATTKKVEVSSEQMLRPTAAPINVQRVQFPVASTASTIRARPAHH